MSDIKVGGHGPDGCTCAIQALGCPVHHCTACGEAITDEEQKTAARGPSGRLHYRCYKRGKAHGRLVADPTRGSGESRQDRLLNRAGREQFDRAEAAEAKFAALQQTHEALLAALKAVIAQGELGNVPLPPNYPPGTKSGSKDVWQFPRHLLVDIHAALAFADRRQE